MSVYKIDLNTESSLPIDFIKRKCDEMSIKSHYTIIAEKISETMTSLGILNNHTTYAVAAACILYVCKKHGLTKINKRRVSYAFGITQPTITKIIREITEHEKVIFDDCLVEQIKQFEP